MKHIPWNGEYSEVPLVRLGGRLEWKGKLYRIRDHWTNHPMVSVRVPTTENKGGYYRHLKRNGKLYNEVLTVFYANK